MNRRGFIARIAGLCGVGLLAPKVTVEQAPICDFPYLVRFGDGEGSQVAEFTHTYRDPVTGDEKRDVYQAPVELFLERTE